MLKKVIADSSVVINLAIIDELRLLKHFFGKVSIPNEVYAEIVVKGSDKPGTEKVTEAIKKEWLEIVEVKDKALLKLLEKDLDKGEAACIAIAVIEKYDLVLLDERDAREIADIYHLKKTGIIGILLRAKFEGIIPDLKSAMDRLITEAHFWIDEKLYKTVIKEASKK